MQESSLITITKVFVLEGKGNTKKEAVESVFSKLRTQAYKSIDYPIVQMTPSDVQILEVKVVDTTEAFMFVFMKRVRQSFQVKMNVEVVIKYIEL